MPPLIDLPTPPILAEAIRADEAPGALEAMFTARAKREGWSDSQAEWIGRLGVAALDGAVSPTPAAIDRAYKAAGRRLSAGYFNHALDEGKSRLVAFLTVIDLEKQVIMRAGGKPPNYPDQALQTAFRALEEAAARKDSVEEQLATAFLILRQQ
ncbi:hypothetical protein ACN9MF_06820 [Methylobacterium fujisawaense]|uniref:Protein of unassigned function n=1 Tax=Methylobacterium oryzae CBMB20 TaxID=693986 RepID=A0A089NTV1_9HYPH|nr:MULTISPECIES: hypothetical protein [Methylobacterium]AIQ89278.1 protein of unassigned function [Methylobacterium oryzae CBMB20]